MDLGLLLEMIVPVLLVYSFVYAAAYVAFSSAQLEKSTKTLIHRIIVPEQPPERQLISFEQLNGLPQPVARYLKLALTHGHEAPHRIRISQDGDIRLKNEEDAWKRFSAREYLQTDQPAFVWDARVDMVSSLFDARVVDNYEQGRAGMRVRLMSALPLVNESDKPELAEGALMRYLGEAVWCPSILLPRRGLQWEAIDEKSARAVLTDRGYTVSLTFHFNERNEVERVETDRRYREVDGRYVPTPWTGYFRDYADRGDMHIPLRAAAQWNLPEGDFTYWRGRVRSIEYDPEPTVWE